MKYRRLTKEEQDNLVEEFAIFLASNSIDKKEWDKLKSEESEKAEEMLDVFSDMIFEKALASCKYLERVSETEMHCYFFQEKQGHLISVQIKDDNGANFLEGNLSSLFIDLLKKGNLEMLQGTKKYVQTREEDMFVEMQRGAQMSKGELYRSLLALL